MVEAFELKAVEDSGATDVSLDVDTSVEGAPSTSSSWKRRLLLVAVPFCVVVFGCIGLLQAHRNAGPRQDNFLKSGAIKGHWSGDEFITIEGVSGLQHLTGMDCVDLKEVYLKQVHIKGFSSRYTVDMEARVAGACELGFFQGMYFQVVLPEDPRAVKGWPLAIPRLRAPLPFASALSRNGPAAPRRKGRGSAGAFSTSEAEVLRSARGWIEGDKSESTGKFEFLGLSPEMLHTEKQVRRMHFSRKAMGVLLGSAAVEPAAAGTWAAQATSVFGACFGGAKASSAAQGAGGFLAQELLEWRVLGDEEPLVLGKKLQKKVAGMMGKEKRMAYVSKLWKESGNFADQVAPAYEVIAELFCLVKRCANAGISTVLDVDDFFTATELRELLTTPRMRKETFKKESVTQLLKSAEAAEQNQTAKAGAERRRSGPRFLLRCWLLLEQNFEDQGAKDQDEEAEIAATAKYLREKLRPFLKADLLPRLKNSKLKVFRRGSFPSKFRAKILHDRYDFQSQFSANFNLFDFPEFLAGRVDEEQDSSQATSEEDTSLALSSKETSDIAILRESAKDADKTVRREAVKRLGQVAPRGSSEDIAILREAVKDADETVRCCAVLSLFQVAEYGSSKDIAIIREAVEDADGTVRRKAVYVLCLGMMMAEDGNGSPEDAATLRVAAKDADETVRGEAVWSLGRVAEYQHGSLEDIAILREAVEDADKTVRRFAVKSLGLEAHAFSSEDIAILTEVAVKDADEAVRLQAVLSLGAVAVMGSPQYKAAIRKVEKDTIWPDLPDHLQQAFAMADFQL